MKIEVIQIKRGSKSRLDTVLVSPNQPKAGEPIYEIDNKKLKIGDGIHDYKDLPYIAGGSSEEGGSSGDSSLDIISATDGQIIVYNATRGEWEAKDLADGQSIEYGQNGLRIAGFTGDVSQNGRVPMANNGAVTWQSPVNEHDLNAAIDRAQQFSNTAEQHSIAAQAAAGNAVISAENTEAFAQQTAELYSRKFWYGTMSDYQTNVVNSGKLTEGTVYFILSDTEI